MFIAANFNEYATAGSEQNRLLLWCSHDRDSVEYTFKKRDSHVGKGASVPSKTYVYHCLVRRAQKSF